jgi:predicted MFS family arabinose efflux permease
MATHSFPRLASGRELAWLCLMNGVSVSTLYWAQSLVLRAAAEFGPSPIVRLMPGATLAGYAAGVALLAAVARDLTTPTGLVLHLLVLTAGLCAAASAPEPILAAAACLIIGLGCSLTQRLLACATSAVPAEARSETIGWIIASGLSGIVLARAFVPVASAWLGWRAMFWTDAVIVTAVGLGATFAIQRTGLFPQHRNLASLPSAKELWRREATLRRAAVQQAVVFAAFNLGWALFPRLLNTDGVEPGIPMGAVASLGAGAAILSGRLCTQRSPAKVASAGLLVAAIAITVLIVSIAASGARSAWIYVLAMALLDISTQAALVGNQARAQSLATSPAMRGRVTAIVTTIGFAGGAIGAALGNLIL